MEDHLKYEIAMIYATKHLIENNLIDALNMRKALNNALMESFLVHIFCVIDHRNDVMHPDWVEDYRKLFYDQIIGLGKGRTEKVEAKVTNAPMRYRLFDYVTTLYADKIKQYEEEDAAI